MEDDEMSQPPPKSPKDRDLHHAATAKYFHSIINRSEKVMVSGQICVLPISGPHKWGATIAHSQIIKLDDIQGRKSDQHIQILAAPHNENSRKTRVSNSDGEATLTEASPDKHSKTITHLRRPDIESATPHRRHEGDDKNKTGKRATIGLDGTNGKRDYG